MRGYDGERGWEIRQGSLSLLKGEVLIELRNDALRAFGAELIRPDEIGARLVLAGQEEVNGKKAHVIEVIPKEGRKVTHFFDADTFLLIKSEGTASEEGTEVEVETWVTDYTVENKVRVPSALDVIRSFPALDREQLFKLRRVDTKVNTGLKQADFSPPSTAPPTWEDAGPVIARYIEAIGGEAALRRAQDRIESWDFSLETQGGESSGKLTIKLKWPDRFILELAGGPLRIVRAYDGKVGWEKNGGSFRRIAGDELVELRNRAPRANGSELLSLKEIGAKAILKGKELVDGNETFVVEVTPREGNKHTYYIDTESFLLRKTAGTSIQGDEAVKMEIWPDSYRMVEGLRLPHKLDAILDVVDSDVELLYKNVMTGVRFNTGLDDSAFSPPTADGEKKSPPPKKKNRRTY